MLTATSQVLVTPELLRLICGYCTPLQNRHNALVSKTWSSEALSVLWYELDSLAPHLGLLAPLKLIDNKSLYKFDRHTYSTWGLGKYTWRVHAIDADEKSADFVTSVFVDIAISRPASDFLPNLSHLTTCHPPALRSLSVASWQEAVSEMFVRLLEVALSNRPHLEEIALSGLRSNTVISEPSISESLSHVLHSGANLTSLALCDTPPLSLSIRTVGDLLKALPSLQKLRLLEYSTAPPTLPL